MVNSRDILETINMIDNEHLDVLAPLQWVSLCWIVLILISKQLVQKFMIKFAAMPKTW